MPKAWIVQNSIKKGEELEITEQGNKLLITSGQQTENQEIQLDVTGLDRTSIVFYIRSAYRKGYDSINIYFENTHTKHLRKGENIKISTIIHEEINRLVGVEVIQQKENSCLIKTISQTSAEDFQNILRRIFILLNDLASDMTTGYAKSNFNILDTVKEKHDNITKFISYSLRLLNKTSNLLPVDRTLMYHTIASIENIVDVLKWGGRRGKKYGKKFNKTTGLIIGQIMETIKLYYDIFYKFDKEKVGKLYEKRHSTKEQIELESKKISIPELMIIMEQAQILDTIVALTEVKISMELKESKKQNT